MLASVRTNKQLNLPLSLVSYRCSGMNQISGKAITPKLIPPRILNRALEFAFWKLLNTQPQNNLNLYVHGCGKRKHPVIGIRVLNKEYKRGTWYEL